ncbi:MAG: glycosyltransferase family 4 protein [Candidatus Pacebacteria bacterium]|nr:glycosyltransferase family 4 protein [Candidatus Paceibacterota bacterium]
MRKKIVYMITKSNWGGAQKYVYDLAKSIDKNEYDVMVAFGGSGALKQKLSGERGIRTIQIESLDRDISIFKDIVAFIDILTLLIREKPDIIHLNSSKMGLLGSLAGKITRVNKRIFTVHGWSFNEKISGVKKFIIKSMSKFTTRCSTDIIVLSETEKEQTEDFTKKVHLIPNGIDLHTKFLSKDESLSKLNLDKRHRYIGVIAELHRNKALDVLISAFSNIEEKSLHLVIIGSGEEKESLQKLVDHSALSSKVHFLGHIDNASECIKAFEIFVLPSRKEGLPYTLLEAGLSKTPVISTTVGGIRSIIPNDGLGFLVKPESSEGLRDKIEILLGNEKLRKDMAETLCNHIVKNFNIKDMHDKTFKVYSNQE